MITLLQFALTFVAGIVFTILFTTYVLISSADDAFSLFSRLQRFVTRFGRGISGGAGDDVIVNIDSNSLRGRKP
jgi:hypothetical protein